MHTTNMIQLQHTSCLNPLLATNMINLSDNHHLRRNKIVAEQCFLSRFDYHPKMASYQSNRQHKWVATTRQGPIVCINYDAFILYNVVSSENHDCKVISACSAHLHLMVDHGLLKGAQLRIPYILTLGNLVKHFFHLV